MSNRYNIEVKVDGVSVSQELDAAYLGSTSKNAAINGIYKAFQTAPTTIGDSGSVTLTVTWKHSRKTREWSAAAKAKAAAKRAASSARRQAAWQEEHKQRQQKEITELRERVKNQVDHAFSLGKHGTEPAAKFITCRHCNAPAALLGLGERLAGAQVINEDAIVGVLCKEHSPYTTGWVEKIPCDKLEFFYDGVRQIAIKP